MSGISMEIQKNSRRNRNRQSDWLRDQFTFRVIARVTLKTDELGIARFEKVLKGFNEVELARRLGREATFLLFVAVKDQEACEEFVMRRLKGLPGVISIESRILNPVAEVYAAYGGSPLKPVMFI
jgi:DNA-binding Lrp family transcriptional regulator